ncbi:hypothetical protein C8A05DRAFT_34321 [Staphylotrichum tortipilum]|uniref:Uncharacterized protein n=1 Tax=Staphylotrichum tortipilum TaxID=2831512 RepID=A0AAN6RTY3_9PEZI|nr:hypothetical protein C8A05DRAFT_34321 [Staphylotrichum longicolle]
MCRLQHLKRAVKGELAQLGIPDTVDMDEHNIVSHASKAHSAIGCVAWAEAKVCRWPIDHDWEEFEHPCWIPAAEHCNEFADMTINGEVDWSDVLRERARRASAVRLTGRKRADEAAIFHGDMLDAFALRIFWSLAEVGTA